MSASSKDEDSTQLFENCRKHFKMLRQNIFRGGRISDSRVCKLFRTNRRQREERLSLKTKTAGNSAQNLTDFLIISSFTRNPAHWPSPRVHWTSGAVDGVETKSNSFRIWTQSYCFLSPAWWLWPLTCLRSLHWARKWALVIYWQPRQLDRPADGSGTKSLK